MIIPYLIKIFIDYADTSFIFKYCLNITSRRNYFL